MGNLGNIFQRLANARRSFRMDDGHDLGTVALDRLAHGLGVDCFSPRGIHANQFSAQTSHDVRHPRPKYPVHADDNLIARFKEIDKAGLHAGAARAGNRNRKGVVGLKEISQQTLRLVHQLKKIRVQVADALGRERPQNPRRYITGPRSHQRTSARINIMKLLGVNRDHKILLKWLVVGREKGNKSNLPEQPGGCYAYKLDLSPFPLPSFSISWLQTSIPR